MLTHSLRRRFVPLLLVALLLSACAALVLEQPSAPAPSVSDQLAQLAARASPTVGAGAAPTAAPTVIKATEPPTSAGVQTPEAPQTPEATETRTPRATRAKATRPAPTRTPSDGLPTIAQSELPREARNTLALIRQGGPFPFDKDGATFQNREGLLPKRASGYYREYTVITPGSRDRGARRIVAGKGGELYYTDDHYDSFQRVIP